MKNLDFYNSAFSVRDEESVFNLFLEKLKPGNMLWSYFVNWDKVFKNVGDIEVELNTLNYLIGKKNFDASFRTLVKKNPEIVKILPALAVRAGKGLSKFGILLDYKKGNMTFESYDFTEYRPDDTDKYLSFLEGTGITELLQGKKIKNLVDYMIGVEAGLDSNARKNRAGNTMENIVEIFIKDFCKKKGYRYIKQATVTAIRKKFGHEIPPYKQNNRHDFAVDTGREVIIFEVNFYNSDGGSKLKSTAGEYIGLHAILKKKNIKFVWITDGPGWHFVKADLRETFRDIDYIFNLHSLENGILIKEF